MRVPAELAAAIPPEPDAEYVGSQDRRTIAQWAQAGLKQGDGSVLKLPSGNDEQAYLFAPTGARGPVFLATVNFDAILHYNQSRRYGLAVALLLNRLQGGPAIAAAWPTDDPGLSRAQIKELQEQLYGRGYDIGVADGIPGAKTRDAVRAEQERRNLPQDGRVGKRILDALKADQPDAMRAYPSR
ncbi:putative peptidoglycan binding domain protein [compost metagenome]